MTAMQHDKLAIAEQFKAVDSQAPYQNDWYGPYNSLLAKLFPFQEGYQVTPRWIIQADNAAPHNRPAWFQAFVSFGLVVQIHGHTVFFADIEEDAKSSNTRSVDPRMRATFAEFADACQLPTLYGVNALGTRYAVYELQVRNRVVLPEKVKHPQARLAEKARAEWWKYDVLQESGFAKLEEIAAKIKEMVRAHLDPAPPSEPQSGSSSPVMELEKSIVKQFESVNPHTSVAKEWYGPYHSLLALLIPFQDGFQISPQWVVQNIYRSPDSFNSTNFMTFHFVVHKDDHIVFLFLVETCAGQKPNTHERANADRRIRDLFLRHSDPGSCKLPKLYAISVLGTDFAVYNLDNETMRMNPTVPNKETHDEDLADIAPCERWAHNVLKKAGFADQIKDSIRENHVNLGGDLKQKKKRRIA